MIFSRDDRVIVGKKINSLYFISSLLCLLSVCALISGCTKQVPSAHKGFFAMDTYMEVTCYGDRAKDAVAAAELEIMRLENKLSVNIKTSEVSLLNDKGSGKVSDELASLIISAKEVYGLSDGAFNISILPVMRLWGFGKEDAHVPDADKLREELDKCELNKLTLSGHPGDYYVTMPEGMQLDFGGIAKGYAADRLVDILDSYEIEYAYMSLGGNVYCYHKNENKRDWNIAIAHPDGEGKLMGGVTVNDKAVVTSGGYQRFFEEDGKKYHHIIDPATGYPAESGLISVTVVCKNSTLADCLSTACYVMGLDKSIKLYKEYGVEYGFELIMMSADGTIYTTDGIKLNR